MLRDRFKERGLWTPTAADAGPAVGRAGRSTDTPETQAAVDARAACVPGVSVDRSPRYARRHRRLGVWSLVCLRPPFLRASELKLVPLPPSSPWPRRQPPPSTIRRFRASYGAERVDWTGFTFLTNKPQSPQLSPCENQAADGVGYRSGNFQPTATEEE